MAKKIDIIPEDVVGGLSAVISVFVNEPNFSSQAKVKLSGKSEGDAIYSALVKEFNKFIKGLSEEQRQSISRKIINNAKIRSAAEVAKITKKKSITIKSPVNLPSNLADCRLAGIDTEHTELYICEGLSALGSVIGARDSNFQGALPIRGKILNVMKMDLKNKKQLERFNNNAEIDDIIKALGAGVGEQFDVDKCRYGKVMFACFSGDTKVQCLDGNAYSFRELVSNNIKELWVYSKDKYGNTVPALATNPRVTRRNQQVLELSLDNGFKVKCTPDHKFMLDDGTFKEAQYLTKEDSLCADYFKENNRGYLELFDKKKSGYQAVHTLVNGFINHKEKEKTIQRFEKEKEHKSYEHVVTHHVDYNKKNNIPTNLKWVTWKEHANIHQHDGYAITKYNKSEEHKLDVKEARKKGSYNKATWKYTYNGSEKHKEDNRKAWKLGRHETSRQALIKWNREHASELITNLNKSKEMNFYQVKCRLAKIGNRLLSSGIEIDDRLFDDKTLRNKVYKKDKIKVPTRKSILKYFSTIENYIEFSKNYNHRVISIKTLSEPEEVYCLTVPKYHNFMINTGDATEFREHKTHSTKRPIKKSEFTNFSGVYVKNCDSDVDGQAINCLLLGVFYRLFRPLIKEGRVYQCVSPFYEFKYKEKGVEKFSYAIDEKERISIEKDLKSKNVKYVLSRAKGLGELNVDVFHNIVLSPKNRKLIRITMKDAEAADRMLNLAIGEGSADDRKEWMIDNKSCIDDLGLYL